MANTLSRVARLELSLAGIRPADWIALHGRLRGRGWSGDACGCPDDRCAGFHHLDGEECGCLRTLIGEYPQG